ncbi:histidine phosphatase family protein [Pseudooceanicola aestuarii]|uniref:histidine phosphatase family protein n=1 Tax=Pseudooceanicola aestuarii TaxID=2697319 RepID=UPI0013D48029|nr:histidine phosphatase family protein [Pseudooceanicola aestuarii]
MTRFHLVRHGPTHQKTFVGWRDVPADLSDTDQIARLNALLPADALVVSSDLQRAVTTADVLSPGRTRLAHDSDLREFDFGEWDGRHFSDIARTDPELSRRFWEDPGPIKAPGGESWDDVAARVWAALDRLHRAHAGRDIVVVAHFGVILTALGRARAEAPRVTLGQKIDTLSVTAIRRGAAGWQVSRINHMA